MTIEAWLAAAEEDARRRGLPELVPMLGALARATGRLRAAAWTRRATGVGPDQPVPPNDGDGA